MCVGLSQAAGDSIRRIFDSGHLGAVDKDPTDSGVSNTNVSHSAESHASAPSDPRQLNDPQTLADLEAQAIIVGNLRRIYGRGLKIVGEEGEMEQCVGAGAQFRDVPRDLLSSEPFPPDHSSLATRDLAVWIDPLDGTKEFTLGFVHYVTVLIGISYRRRALAGVVHVPFVGGKYQQAFDPLNPSHRSDRFAEGLEGDKVGRTIWGAVGVGVRGISVPDPASIPADRRYITTTRSHYSPTLKALLESQQPQQVIRCGGAGSKGLLVLSGDADAYLFPSTGTKRWDTCAIDALITAEGGRFTDQYGEPIDYDPEASPENVNGLLATMRNHDQFVLPKPTLQKEERQQQQAGTAETESHKANL